MKQFKLLTVDDDPSVTEFVSLLAADAGFVTQSISGEKVHTVYEHFEPHVLVLDINMPGRSGAEVLQFCAKQKNRPQFIILSGTDSTHHREVSELAKSLGFPVHDVIAKPFDPIALETTLKKLYASFASPVP